MSTLLALVISGLSALLQLVATLNVSAYSWWNIYQPRTPKSMLK